MKGWFLLVLAVVVASLVPAEAQARRGKCRGGRCGFDAVPTAPVALLPAVTEVVKTDVPSQVTVTMVNGLRVAIEPTLQEVAQKRADALAAQNVLDHNVHLYTNAPAWNAAPGVSEGIGYTTASDPAQCPTCITGGTVVADAHARNSSGRLFRVRLFR